jgi:hypothetical protein
LAIDFGLHTVKQLARPEVAADRVKDYSEGADGDKQTALNGLCAGLRFRLSVFAGTGVLLLHILGLLFSYLALMHFGTSSGLHRFGGSSLCDRCSKNSRKQ